MSRLSLDSSRTFAPIAHNERLAVMRAGREAGLTGGVLAGKSAAGTTSPQACKGRSVGLLEDPRVAPAVRASSQLLAQGRTLSTDPAALAIGFGVINPIVATVLFGATDRQQVRDNVAALEPAGRLDQDIAALPAIRAIKAT